MSQFKEINISNPGTSTKFGGNDTDILGKLLNGITSGIPPVRIRNQNKFGFDDGILWIYNQALSKKTTIRGQANVPATDLDLRLPPITANDTLAAVGIQNVWAVRQELDAGELHKEMDIPGVNPPATTHLLFVGLDGHLRKLSPTGILTDYNVSTSIPSYFPTGILRIQNPAQSFYYNVVASAITADRNIILPLITGNDTFATLGLGQTFTGNNTFGGTSTFNGNVVFNGTTTIIGSQTFGDDDLQILNPIGNFKYIFSTSAIVTDRIITIPLMTADGNMVIDSFANTFTATQILANNIYLRGTRADAATRTLIGVAISNMIQVGDISGSGNAIEIWSGGASAALGLSSTNTVTTSPTWGVNQVFNNNLSILQKDSGGTNRQIFKLNSSNSLLFGDSAGITGGLVFIPGGNVNALTISAVGFITSTALAQTGVVEIINEFRVSDSSSYIRIQNNTSADGNFAPLIKGRQVELAALEALRISGTVEVAHDTGNTPIMIFYTEEQGGIDISTRPLYDFRNRSTSVLRINAGGDNLNTSIAKTGVAEVLEKWTVSDDATSFLQFNNGFSADGVLVPVVVSHLAGASTPSHAALYHYYEIPAANDSGATPVVIFNAYRHTATGNIVIRPLFDFRNNSIAVLRINANGDVFANVMAQAGVAETLSTWRMSDDATSSLVIFNQSTGDGMFAPTIQALTGPAVPSTMNTLYIKAVVDATLDTGTTPIIAIRTNTGITPFLITTRPILDIQNFSTSVFKIGAKGDTLNTTIATTGVSEALEKWQVSDDALSFVDLLNIVSTDGVFGARWRNRYGGANTAISAFTWEGQIDAASDSGSTPLGVFLGQTTVGGVIGTRPLFDFKNGTNIVFRIDASGKAIFQAIAQAGAAEVIAKFTAIDNNASYMEIRNASTVDAVYGTHIVTYLGATVPTTVRSFLHSCYISSGSDSGTTAAYALAIKKSDETAITTRPYINWFSAGTLIFDVGPTSTGSYFDLKSNVLRNADIDSSVTGAPKMPSKRKWGTWQPTAASSLGDGLLSTLTFTGTQAYGTDSTDGGKITFDTTATINTPAGIRNNTSIIALRALNPRFKAKFRLNQLTDTRMYIGFRVGGIMFTNDDPANAAICMSFGFSSVINATNWIIWKNDPAGATVIVDTGIAADINLHTVEIVGSSTKFTYSLDGAAPVDVTGDIPNSFLGFGANISNVIGASKTFELFYLELESDK